MNTTPNSKINEMPQAIKYVGLYKPNRPYTIGNGFLILPAGDEMVDYGIGSAIHEMRHNVSYFASEREISLPELMTQYRTWLAFDAFILGDDSPIRAFDLQKIGHPEAMPNIVPDESTALEYFKPDYDNISGVMFGCTPDMPGLPQVSYSDFYQRYLTLPTETKEMIEWFVSFPTSLSQVYCRPQSFFNANYWQILHMTTLVDQIVGSPATCPQSPRQCACGSTLQPHHTPPRREWLRQFLRARIDSAEILEDYAYTIETAYKIRNPMSHGPHFDRSTHEAPQNQPEVYDASRAATDYKHDSAALMLLNLSLRDVVRNLLMLEAFGIKFFQPLRKLTSFPVKN